MKKFRIRFGNMVDEFNERDFDAIVVTTNGFIKKDGEAVMGKGIAKTMSEIFPKLPALLGKKLHKKGNIVHLFKIKGTNIVTMPVKPVNTVAKKSNNDHILKRKRNDYQAGHIVPGFFATSDLRLIERSLRQLVELADEKGWKHIAMPRPGCGNGELKWKDVRVLCSQILDNRFHVYTFKKNKKKVLIMDYPLAYNIINKAIDNDIKVITTSRVLAEYTRCQGYKNFLLIKKSIINKKWLRRNKISNKNFIFGKKKDLAKVNKLLRKS